MNPFATGFRLPAPLQEWVEGAALAFLQSEGGPTADFAHPPGEPGLAGPNSVSWQVFRNPVPLLIGGIAAVVLEFAEPRVRTGVWEHSSFRTDPVERLRRTGLAAMVTVYAARTVSEGMIQGIRSAHEAVAGATPAGIAYRASDPELLSWVQATAEFGFLEAYCRYVTPLSLGERDRLYAEGEAGALLYGATAAPRSTAEMNAFFRKMRPLLEPSPILIEFLTIMRRAPLLPPALRAVQDMLVRAAVDIVPPWAREILGLGDEWRLQAWEARLIAAAAEVAHRYRLDSSPPAQACIRMGLAPDYLHRRAVGG